MLSPTIYPDVSRPLQFVFIKLNAWYYNLPVEGGGHSSEGLFRTIVSTNPSANKNIVMLVGQCVTWKAEEAAKVGC
jgi:hypothetical protein